MPKSPQAPRRAMVYRVVPADLADKLHRPLREHFAADPAVDVVVEQRWRDRRRRAERRSDGVSSPADDPRRIQAQEGRRVADRRASAMASTA